MLSKKYYKVIAEILAVSQNKQEICERLIGYLKIDNERFNANRFRDYINKIESDNGLPITSFSITMKYVIQ